MGRRPKNFPNNGVGLGQIGLLRWPGRAARSASRLSWIRQFRRLGQPGWLQSQLVGWLGQLRWLGQLGQRQSQLASRLGQLRWSRCLYSDHVCQVGQLGWSTESAQSPWPAALLQRNHARRSLRSQPWSRRFFKNSKIQKIKNQKCSKIQKIKNPKFQKEKKQ